MNSVDYWSSNVCALSLTLGVMLSSAESNVFVQYLGYSLIILLNLSFVLWMAGMVLSAYMEVFDDIVNKIKLFICKMFPSMRKILKPKEFDPERLR